MTEIAWAAGLWDGEGCAQITAPGPKTHRGSYKYVSLSISQMDRRVLDRFQKAFGAGNVRGPYQDGRYFVWSTSAWQAVLRFEELIVPLLSPVKADQFRKALKQDSRK